MTPASHANSADASTKRGRQRLRLGGTESAHARTVEPRCKSSACCAWEFRESLASSGLAARVPGLTLYDTPVAAAARNVPLREGKPPPIR